MKKILSALAFIFSTFFSYSQQTSTDTMQWTESRKLDWNDFTGKATGKNGVLGHATMIMNAKYHKGLKKTTSVEAVFDRKSSFAAANEKTPAMLKYYQTLFDLYEAECRTLRKQFKETRFGLDPDKVFKEKYDAALKALGERVDDYMEETETGNNGEEVNKWAKNLQLELKELEAFKK